MFNRVLGSVLISSSAAILYGYHQRKNVLVVHADVSKAPLSSYRPSDYLHVHYAKQAYQNSGGEVESDWETLQFYQNTNDGYFGVAYRNIKNKHIIFAHRGTEDFKDWIIDFNTIIHRLNEQQISAWDRFAKKIITEHGPSYTYSFTGHSLGGWLAEACLWKYQDEFFKEYYPTYQDAFSVTLDDPGGKELLEALQPRVETSYRIAVDKLDRTNYVSYPNLVNTALGREGATVYTLLPRIEPSWIMRHTVMFTVKMHSSQVLLEEFDQKTGLPKESYRVLDWPRVVWGKGLPSTDSQKGLLGCLAYMVGAYQKGEIERGEYLGFYTYKSDTVNAPEQLPVASQFKLRHGTHYRTIPFNPQILPLRNMPRVAREFLEELSHYRDRSKVVIALIEKPIRAELSDLLNNYSINDREECVLNSPLSARTFQEAILGFLNENSFLYQTPLRILREEYILKQTQKNVISSYVPVAPFAMLRDGGLGMFRLRMSSEIEETLNKVEEQIQQSKTLVSKLSFNQGTARLYQFSEPTWDEIKSLENEQLALTQQILILHNQESVLETMELKEATKTKASTLLKQHKEQLEIAEQSVNVLMHYLKNRLDEANQGVAQLIVKIKSLGESDSLDKNLLLNRAYNLQAKIAVRMDQLELAKQYYQQAVELLPEDFLTASNYGGLLTDLGRFSKNPTLYVEAYQHFQKVLSHLSQIKESEKGIIYSGIAYNYLLLARSVEKGKLKKEGVGSINFQQLRIQAQDLLKLAISADPYCVNARLFLAILRYDEKKYLEALEEVNMALTLQPQHPTALMRKGTILDKLEQSEEALAALYQSKSMMFSTKANLKWSEKVNKKIAKIETRVQETAKPKL